MTSLFDLDRGATFSPCGIYRYALWRLWADTPPLLFLMLNPSTADETSNDPTVERCERRARALGFGGLRVANLFALRSTDPRALRHHPDPVGPENDRHILAAARKAAQVVCAWGIHGRLGNRSQAVTRLLLAAGIPLHILSLTRDSEPSHPLYLPYHLEPQPWIPAFGP